MCIEKKHTYKRCCLFPFHSKFSQVQMPQKYGQNNIKYSCNKKKRNKEKFIQLF